MDERACRRCGYGEYEHRRPEGGPEGGGAMKTISIVILLFSTGALVGCDKEPTSAEAHSVSSTTTPNAAPVTAPATPTPPQAPVAIADSDLSTPADFEEEAEKSITTKSYKTELA